MGWVDGGEASYAFGGEGLVTLDVGAELAGLVADGVGVAGGGHDWWVWLMLCDGVLVGCLVG